MMTAKKEALLRMFEGWQACIPADVIPYADQIIENITDEEIDDFMEKYEKAGTHWGFSESSDFVDKTVGNVLRKLLTTSVTGQENLENALDSLKRSEASKLIFVSNHLSYSDTNIFLLALKDIFDKHGFGHDLTVIAGPKVFAHPLRKFASMHFNTLLLIQSHSVSTTQVEYSVREIARAALKVRDDIRDRVKIVFIFPEGKRSRDGQIKQFLPGVYKLIDIDEKALVMPVAITGGDQMLPVSHADLRYANATVTLGRAEYVADIKAGIEDQSNIKQEFMDYLGRKVAALLPESFRGFYK